jgi:hypothetical protein
MTEQTFPEFICFVAGLAMCFGHKYLGEHTAEIQRSIGVTYSPEDTIRTQRGFLLVGVVFLLAGVLIVFGALKVKSPTSVSSMTERVRQAS